jgi:hypothetical protein
MTRHDLTAVTTAALASSWLLLGGTLLGHLFASVPPGA